MADETTATAATIDQKERALDARAISGTQAQMDRLKADPPAEPEIPAADRLRAFEDVTFGIDAVRIRGQVERGYGSKFKEMTPEQRSHYEALENLIIAENNLAGAKEVLARAEVDHEAAVHAAATE